MVLQGISRFKRIIVSEIIENYDAVLVESDVGPKSQKCVDNESIYIWTNGKRNIKEYKSV